MKPEVNVDNNHFTEALGSVFGEFEKEFDNYYCRSDFQKALKGLKSNRYQSKRPEKLSQLYKLFDAFQIDYLVNKDDAYYEKLVQDNIEKLVYDRDEIVNRILYKLYQRYDKYPTPEKYMQRIVENLKKKQPDDQEWENDTLRVRILKQFVKYGGYLETAGYKGRSAIEKYSAKKIHKKAKDMSIQDVIEVLDEGVFDCLVGAKDDQLDPKGTYGLLKLADDLAKGNFRGQGGTRRGLYLFAMAYDMKFYPDDSMKEYDKDRDIEKNLFRDYYNNNLMRFISEEYRGNTSAYENPSGRGINYKNFAEVIYLYYLSKTYSPEDKIRLSNAMIDRLKKSKPEKEKAEYKTEQKETQYYKGFFVYNRRTEELFDMDILNLSEEEFEIFVSTHFNCDSKGISPVQLEFEQNTAYNEYKKILNQLAEKLKENDLTSEEMKKGSSPLDYCNYGLWFTDVSAYGKEGLEKLYDKSGYKDMDKEKFAEFMEVLLGVNSFLGNTVKENINSQNENQEHSKISKKRIKALSVKSAKDVTRTSLVVAYYYYFNACCENEDTDELIGFRDVFERFSGELDPILENCGYQEINKKNFFDMLVILSAYAYLAS